MSVAKAVITINYLTPRWKGDHCAIVRLVLRPRVIQICSKNEGGRGGGGHLSSGCITQLRFARQFQQLLKPPLEADICFYPKKLFLCCPPFLQHYAKGKEESQTSMITGRERGESQTSLITGGEKGGKPNLTDYRRGKGGKPNFNDYRKGKRGKAKPH